MRWLLLAVLVTACVISTDAEGGELQCYSGTDVEGAALSEKVEACKLCTIKIGAAETQLTGGCDDAATEAKCTAAAAEGGRGAVGDVCVCSYSLCNIDMATAEANKPGDGAGGKSLGSIDAAPVAVWKLVLVAVAGVMLN